MGRGGTAVALGVGMEIKAQPLRCYIASVINRQIDPFLEKHGFCHSLIIFAVPELGLLFRCRADGDGIDLEFGAFFSLLRFLKQYLVQDKLDRLQVLSSCPEFVFSFTKESKHLAKGTAREKLLREYADKMQIEVAYIEPQKNRCLVAPSEFPSMPASAGPVLKPTVTKDTRIDIRPYQRGIRL
jgi:hypothetical protein